MRLYGRIHDHLMSRLKDYYSTISDGRYVTTVTFLDPKKIATLDVVPYVSNMRGRCAIFRDIDITVVKMDVYLEKNHAFGFTKVRGQAGCNFKFQECWFYQNNEWYNRNVYPDLEF